MANFWTFRDGQTGELVEHDIGSATLVGFLAGNPTLGPVRRGKKETPEAKFTYGGDRPSSYTPPALGGEADPWSTSATTENPVPEGYWVAPSGNLVETAQHRAAEREKARFARRRKEDKKNVRKPDLPERNRRGSSDRLGWKKYRKKIDRSGRETYWQRIR
jgi:hypothetical protein